MESSTSRALFVRCRLSALFGVAAALTGLSMMPAPGQQPATGVYTYRHGYDPGYYGSSRLPIDPGAKLGQAITQGDSQYWYMPPSPEPAPPPTTPHNYAVRVTLLPHKTLEEDANAVLIVAHLPEDAQIWFEGQPTVQKGNLRLFTSPPLTPGKDYTYTVRVRWVEDGRQFSQTGLIPVHAGEVHCIDLVTLDAVARAKDDEAKIQANLARMSNEDRKLAFEQKFCAVQNRIRLGSMGTPMKITLKGQPVFLCCGACAKTAESNADKTLENVKSLLTKSKGS
jgi:uncharacterized protein (TIGR03000 family)